MRQPEKVFSEARIEQASSRFEIMLYSLALFQLSYPEDLPFMSVRNSPRPVMRQCVLWQKESWKRRGTKNPKSPSGSNARSAQDHVKQKKMRQPAKVFSEA